MSDLKNQIRQLEDHLTTILGQVCYCRGEEELEYEEGEIDHANSPNSSIALASTIEVRTGGLILDAVPNALIIVPDGSYSQSSGRSAR